MKHRWTIISHLLFFTLYLNTMSLFAGTTGKILGTIKDSATGESMIGVNVVVEGTRLGASTDIEGIYIIMNVPPGVYSVKASMLGYKMVTQKNVYVSVDLTSKTDFKLESTVIEGEMVVVDADRPLVKRDETAKTTILDFEVFSDMPIQEVSEAISAQSGFITDESGGLHLRGGRSGEIAYMVDGILVQDPFYKSGAGSVLIDKNVIQELQVMTGAFSAEYGQAMSGVINVVTKEGSNNKYEGRLEHESHWLNASPYREIDWMQTTELVDISSGEENDYLDAVRWYRYSEENPDSLFSTPTDYDQKGFSKYAVPTLDAIPGEGKIPKVLGVPLTGYLTGSLSGPVPFMDNLSFFVSGRYSNYYSHLHFGYDASRDANFKLTYRLNNFKINANAQRSRRYSQPYQHSWKYNRAGYDQTQDIVDRVTFEFKHTLGQKTFHTVRLSHYERGFLRYNPNRNFKISDYPESIYMDSEKLDSVIIADSDWEQMSLNADGFYVEGDRGRYEDNQTVINTVKYDIVSQISNQHEIKSGLEYNNYNIQRDRWIAPWANAPHYIEIFEYDPYEFSAYVQDKMEYDRFVLNLGLRYDHFQPNHSMWEDIYVAGSLDAITGLWVPASETKAEAQQYFSPRIGIAYPVTDKIIFHSSYGHFYEKPGFYEMYKSHDVEADRHPLIGNPKIKNQKTVQYEFGVKSQFAADWTYDINVYYKDITNLVASTYHIGFPYHFTVFDNSSYASVKGAEITLERQMGRFFTGVLNYSISVAKGNESSSSDGYNFYRGADVSDRPNREYYLDFDRRHDFSFNSIFRTPKGYGPRYLGFRPFEKWNMNILMQLASGLPYTPSLEEGFVDVFVERNTGRKPWFHQIDVRLQKSFRLSSGIEMVHYLVVKNLLNSINTNYVWTTTGKAWDDGVESSYSMDRQHNPENVGIPRQISYGIRLTL